MIKKIAKYLSLALLVVLLLIVLASIVIMLVVSKEMVAGKMEQALNRRVTIAKISVSVFSSLSGIEVREVKISNFADATQRQAKKGQPIAAEELFVELQKFSFKAKLLPLISGRLELQELLFSRLLLNAITLESGAMNFSDLLSSETEESAPIKADDLPLDMAMQKIGLENGVINYIDKKTGDQIQVYNATLLLQAIQLDPARLQEKNSAAVESSLACKTVGAYSSGAMKSFDIAMKLNAKVIPFDLKTRLLDPEISARIESPRGEIRGVKMLSKIRSLTKLTQYCGGLNFIPEDLKWNKAAVDIWLKGNQVKISNGSIPTADFLLGFAGAYNMASGAADLSLSMLLNEKHTATIQSGIENKVRQAITPAMKKYVSPEKVTDLAMAKMVNAQGRVYLEFSVSGSLASPQTTLVNPKLPTIAELIKAAAGDAKDVAAQQAKEQGKNAAKKEAAKLKKKIRF